MPEQEQYDAVRGKIEVITGKKSGFHSKLDKCEIDQILSLPEILIEDENQNLPEYKPEPIWARVSFRDVQQDMLNNNWKKVIKK